LREFGCGVGSPHLNSPTLTPTVPATASRVFGTCNIWVPPLLKGAWYWYHAPLRAKPEREPPWLVKWSLYAATTESESLQARSQRLQASAHTRQCSMFISTIDRSWRGVACMMVIKLLMYIVYCLGHYGPY
jgi:hypothetical protein